ncbi:MFS family permease [Sphingomonas kaistensis]|uniref:MFS family permease n=1 Tax=Sphingomonas kaistensis TaxID=298708 RepID=A0A7X5Y9K4_9SPHN|nr:MFS transporter [Sphingomonas kaistensis]NJC06445.1 MFS family permease [Sphingomonas kaistensis]
MPAEAGTAALQSRRFLWLYALAAAGGAVAYVPFLTILLPMRVSAMAGADDVAWLAFATFFGAISASLSNIAFGWASDATRRRVPWIAAGLLLSCLLLGSFGAVAGMVEVIVLLVGWQVALNMMLAPLAAWAGDHVPDAQKGRLGGLLAFAPAAGAGAGVLVTLPGLASADQRLWLVAALVAMCVAPVLLFGRPRDIPGLGRGQDAGRPEARPRGEAVRMWIARLLVQVSEAALFAFLFFWFRAIDPAMTDARVAQIFSLILLGAVPLALTAGRWADRHDRPFAPLMLCAAGAACGLLIMAGAPGLEAALAGYFLFGLSASVFLSLHSAQTLRVLPRAEHRGRDLGIFNLTNTGPSLVMPWLTLALVPAFGFTALFLALAAFAAAATILLWRLPRKL